MMQIFNIETYNTVLIAMSVLAVVVFIALQFIEAPYGIAFRKGWGPSVNNRIGWIAMEAPAFIAMCAIAIAPCYGASCSTTSCYAAPYYAASCSMVAYILTAFFLFHYFQRSFIFPLLMRGNSRMPWTIALMGALFNIINAYMIGGWLFHVAPPDYYLPVARFFSGDFSAALSSPKPLAAIAGAIIFVVGMAINWQSDHIIRHLRHPGETGHKIPHGGMYNYVTSANYLGEIIEWTGFALLTFSWAGAVFVLWTCANLVPRSAKLHKRYLREFGDEYRKLNRRRIFPFIY
jgi:3-oxo-5-alpha-steroid 4-dehydrogenase 1